MSKSIEPNTTINDDGELVFEAPAGAHLNEMSSSDITIVAGLKLCKSYFALTAALGTMHALNADPATVNDIVSPVIRTCTYAAISFATSVSISTLKQKANDRLSTFPNQVAQVNLAKEFLKELNPLRGFRSAVKNRSLAALAI